MDIDSIISKIEERIPEQYKDKYDYCFDWKQILLSTRISLQLIESNKSNEELNTGYHFVVSKTSNDATFDDGKGLTFDHAIGGFLEKRSTCSKNLLVSASGMIFLDFNVLIKFVTKVRVRFFDINVSFSTEADI